MTGDRGVSSGFVGLVSTCARARIVHFVAIGALLFAVAPKERNARDISITSEQADAVLKAAARRQGIAQLPAEARTRVLDELIEDELLYREGVRLGLDRDDAIVRSRVIQKMLFLAEDVGGAAAPASDDEVRAFYEATPQRWTAPAAVDFEHVFVASSKHEASDRRAAEGLHVRLSQDAAADASAMGDAFPLMRKVIGKSRADVEGLLGPAVAEVAFAVEPGTWSEPVESPFGFHLVRVSARAAGTLRPLSAVDRDVRLALGLERKRKAVRALVTRLFGEYRIHLELPPGTTSAPTFAPTFAPTDRIARAEAVD